ncbi:helix-turn-helix domain-containing protein [Pseudomonas sp. GCM10022186]|uniref:helix-turn-helix domain-containing protein n=1 Tax=Pseudomonas sp. GCM10022186 TaxID=3252650 RepID=UPI00360B9660
MKDLAFIPLPLPEESPTSLLKRAAIRNGYRSIDRFISFYFHDLPVRFNLLRQDSIVTEHLSHQAGEYAEPLKLGFYKAAHRVLSNSNLMINNIEVKKRLIRFKGAAICSECCSEGWEKIIKDFSLAENCPYHCRKYLHSCPKCQRRFTWHNQITVECKCGEKIKSPRCSEAEARPEKQLLRLLRSNSQHSFDLFASTLQSLGLGSQNSNPSINRRIFTTALAIAVEDMEIIVPSLQNLFSSISLIDESLIAAKLSHLTPPHIKSFILNQLSSDRPAPRHPSDLTLALTTQQLLNHFGINNKQWKIIRKHKLFPKKEKRCSTFSQQEAATIKHILELITWRRRLAPPKKEIGKFVDLPTAAHHLKVCMHVLRELVNSGLLGKKYTPIKGPHEISSAAVRNFDRKYVCIQTIAHETNSTINTIKTIVKHLAITTIPLAHESKFTTVISRKSAKQVIATLNESYPPRTREAQHKFSAQLPTIESNERTNYYSTSEASKLLEIDRTTIRQFIKNGVLNATHKAKFGEYLIPKIEVENFNKKYIGVSEASKTLLLPRNKTTAILAAHGITPVTGKTVGSGDTTLFDRSDICKETIKTTETNAQTFYREHSSNRLVKFSEACSLTGTTRKSLSIITKAIILPYRQKHYQSIKKFSSIELKAIQDYLNRITPASRILEQYKISLQSFSKLFLLSGYIKHIKIDGILYLEPEDKSNVIKVLEEFCTCTQADSMLGATPRFTRNLIKCGKIETANPPSGIPLSPTLLERKLVLDLKNQNN